MPWTIDSALEDESLNLLNRDDGLGVYKFTVGELKSIVSVQVTRLPQSEEAVYHRSHNIKTPVQAGPYIQSRLYWDDVPYALHQAVDSITSWYRAAVKAGHSPNEGWLVAT